MGRSLNRALNRARLRASILAVALLGIGCGDNSQKPDAGPGGDGSVDGPADAAMPDANPLTPATLAGTGLCTDPGCTAISADVRAYVPRFELWADTATKRRWVQLPAGATIDTADMDFWVFPVGTKFWKEFTRDGTRVETRYIVKLLADDNAPGAWFYAAYQWNQTQDETTLVTDGVENANMTGHDIPSRAHCRECHDEVNPTRVLGFGAIQLDHTPADTSLLDLEDLIADNTLSVPPTSGTAGARFPLPGTPTEQAALGYLHANCGHCHNPTSSGFGHTPVDLRLVVGALGTAAATPAYTSAVGVEGLRVVENGMSYETIVVPGDPDNSTMIVRMLSTNPAGRMPFRGSEIVDPTGLATLRAWITSL